MKLAGIVLSAIVLAQSVAAVPAALATRPDVSGKGFAVCLKAERSGEKTVFLRGTNEANKGRWDEDVPL